VTATANIGIAIADLTRAKFVLANSEEIHVPESWLQAPERLRLMMGDQVEELEPAARDEADAPHGITWLSG
jgi:hypothetical protein